MSLPVCLWPPPPAPQPAGQEEEAAARIPGAAATALSPGAGTWARQEPVARRLPAVPEAGRTRGKRRSPRRRREEACWGRGVTRQGRSGTRRRRPGCGPGPGASAPEDGSPRPRCGQRAARVTCPPPARLPREGRGVRGTGLQCGGRRGPAAAAGSNE